MKIFNKNLLLEVKKSGEEGPFNEAEAELLVGKGYTCRLDAGDDVYYCTPPKSEKKDDKKTEKKDDKKTEKKDGTGTSQDDSGGNQGQSQGGGQDRSRANEIPSHIECEAWENENKFTKKFPGQENEKAKDFKDWLYNYVSPGSTMAKYYNFAYSYQSKYDGFCSPSTKEYETDEILHKSPFIRELATFESRGKILFDWWIETSGGNFSKKSSPTNVDSGQKTQNNNQVKNDETKNQQMNSTQIKSKDFDSAQEMFNEIKSSDIYTLDANLSSQVNKYENLFKLSNSTNIEDRRAGKSCSTLVSTYVSAAQSRVDRSFGNPETKKTNPGVYKQVSTYWYEFLESLVSIKNKIYSCGVKRYIDSDQSELLTTTQRVVGSPWPVALSNPDHDDNTLQDFFNELTESVIKRKLEQKLEEKLIKESIRKKLLLKSLNFVYEPYEVSVGDIKEVWEFVNYISTQMPESNQSKEEVNKSVTLIQEEMRKIAEVLQRKPQTLLKRKPHAR